MSTAPNAGSPLRHRMIEDMTIRRFTEKTQGDHLRHVRAFAAFLGCIAVAVWTWLTHGGFA